MKKNIRVLNHREYDINSFTPKARRKIVQLFDQHRKLTERLETLRKQYSVNLEIEDGHEVLNYQEEKRQLRARVEYIEALIYQIDADYRNRSGITLKKLIYPVVKLIVSDFFPAVLSMGYLGFVIYQIKRSANPVFSIEIFMGVTIILLLLRGVLRREMKLRLKEQRRNV